MEKLSQTWSLMKASWGLLKQDKELLVFPILVIEEKGPITALKESTAMLRQTWGQQLIGNFSFGLIFFLLGIPAFLIIALGVAAGSGVVLLLCGVIAAVYLIVLALVQSALQAIFQAALYYYARKGRIPSGFDGGALQGAMSTR